MPVDFSFLENAAPKAPEPEKPKNDDMANVAVRVDAESFLMCDGEYIDIIIKADQVTKTKLPTGQHLLEFISTKDSQVKVEKTVDFPEGGKNYLVIVDGLKSALTPPPLMPQQPAQPQAPKNPYLDQLNQMQWNNPLATPTPPAFPQGGNN